MNTLKRLLRPLAIATLAMGISFSSKACICSEFLTLDSLAQMAEYSFIAHVKILEDQPYKEPTKDNLGDMGVLTIRILELFKGDSITRLLEYSRRTSCDIGIAKGEEWLLFGRNINGKIAVVACDRNKKYRGKDEVRFWRYNMGMYELNRLKELYQHPIKTFTNETRKEYYSNGRQEIEETYVNGKRNGARTIWHSNGILRCREFYINDTLDGKSEWFYSTGQIEKEEYRNRGKSFNTERTWYDTTENKIYQIIYKRLYEIKDTLPIIFPKMQIQYERIYDAFGNTIIYREFNRLGIPESEKLHDNERNIKTSIYYHKNGKISSIGYSKNGESYGRYQTYDENGFVERTTDYDENGKEIKVKKEKAP